MTQNSPQTLTGEDRLKSVAYQMSSLYERWSEDRQQGAKQASDLAELIKALTEQVNRFENLESEVRKSLRESIAEESQTVGKDLSREAVHATEAIANKLAN